MLIQSCRLSDTKRCFKTGFIESDNNLAVDLDDRNTLSAGKLLHFLLSLLIAAHITFFKRNSFFRKILFRSFAVRSGCKRVYFYFVYHNPLLS